MYISVKQLANSINNLKRIEPESMKHYKVYFEIAGKKDPFTWFCFATDYQTAKKAAYDFLDKEISKGFYTSGTILAIKEI